jgi:DNA polymerase elongation subunit (family B)
MRAFITGLGDLKKAIDIGQSLKKEVNKGQREIEIEIDGIFANMLLLKKKVPRLCFFLGATYC